MLPMRRSVAVWLLLMSALASSAAGQANGPAALVIDGPPPPAPPEVVARDELGRVTVRAERVRQPIRVDGLLDEQVYQTVPAISGFIQQEPREGEPATEPTEVWLLFDDRFIYVAARCWDSHPERIVANEMRRDHQNIFMNDNFAVIFDTFYDRRNGFMFYTNAVGGMSDVYVTEERESNRDWNTVWYSKSRRFDRGWTVEMAIPFRSLRYRGSGPQIWGVNFRRIVRWKNEFSYLTRIPASFGMRGLIKLSSAATLVGLEAPPAALSLEVKPYATAGVATDLTVSPAVTNRFERDVGVDVKYGVTPGLTLDVTYNTDFAQVEDDEQQVNLSRVSLFFPEKRDFFLEGQGIFSFGGLQSVRGGGPGGGGGGPGMWGQSVTPILFFSRRIGLVEGRRVPIVAGTRLTGKAGRYSLGALAIRTGGEPAVGAVTTDFAVLRVKRDILRRSSVGVIATRRAPALGGGTDNWAVGVDAGLAFYDNLLMDFYYARTRTPGRSGDEASYRANFLYNGDRYGVEVERLTVGDGFNPEVGLLRREDFRRNFIELRFSPRPRRFASVRKFYYQGSLDYTTDTRGRLETRELQFEFRTEFQRGDNWSVNYERRFEFLPEPLELAETATVPVGAYHFQHVRTSYQLGPQRRITGWLNAQHGSFFGGRRTEAGYRGRVEITHRMSVEPGISVNWVDLPTARFTSTLLSTRSSFAFSPQAMVSALVQYNSSRHVVTTNVRFRWEYQPGSDLFLVYNEGRDTLDGLPSTLRDRSVVLKLTRLIRF